jgi:hypothetical protein
MILVLLLDMLAHFVDCQLYTAILVSHQKYVLDFPSPNGVGLMPVTTT